MEVFKIGDHVGVDRSSNDYKRGYRAGYMAGYKADCRTKGLWFDHYYLYFEIPGIECSICHKDVPYWTRGNPLPDYCPNCGAKMEVEHEQ